MSEQMEYTIEAIKNRITVLAADMERMTVMEVCGTHTSGIHRYGIRELLPDNIRLVSGPGCPVCVTSQNDVAAAVLAADREDVIFACFGDMMRVPCGETSLYSLYEKGRDIRVVTSPMDALHIAADHPDKHIIYFGIGFETTAPHSAALIEAAERSGIGNISVLCAHKTMPRAIIHLLNNGSGIDALMCPGHVAAVTGADAFSFVSEELGIPAAIAGFEAYDIMAALLCLVDMLGNGERKCVNMYPRAVKDHGSEEALSLLYRVFEPCDAIWRGLGKINGSGLKIKKRFEGFDASKRFDLTADTNGEAEGCICADILRGRKIPAECVNFGMTCTPQYPIGACMVSSEGSCAAYYRYGWENEKCRKK
jgi:hydrogenase expression/formation protein HypD